MKKVRYWIGVLLPLLAAACTHPSYDKGFTLSVEIRNTNPGACYLVRLPLAGEPVVVDSFDLTQLDESFELHDVDMDSTCMYQLQLIPARATIYIVSDTRHASLRLNAVDPMSYAIEGSAESRALQQIQQIQKPFHDTLYILGNKQQNQIGDPDSLQREAQRLRVLVASNYTYFADTVSHPLAALFIGQQIDFGQDLGAHKAFIASLNRRFPRNPWIARHVRSMQDYFSLLDTEYQVGDRIPAGRFMDTNGKVQQPDRWQGKPYLLEFWASYCPDCLVSLQQKKDLYVKYHPDGFQLIAFSLDTEQEMLQAALGAAKFPFPVVADLGGWSGSAAQTYKIDSIPFNLLIGADGRVLEKNISAEALKSYLENQMKME